MLDKLDKFMMKYQNIIEKINKDCSSGTAIIVYSVISMGLMTIDTWIIIKLVERFLK
jgi:hypothetical protein